MTPARRSRCGYQQRFTTRRPEYLLTGLVRCGKCRRRYVGVSANGKRHRYRYYICWTRSRYGVAGCDAERLRADELEKAAFGSLLAVYADPDLLRDASAARLAADQAGVEQREQELVSVDGELRKVEAAIERYMLAFENGSVTEEAFGPRVRELGEQAQALRAHQAEVATSIAAAHSGRLPSAEDLLVVHRQLREALDTAPDTVRKAIAQAFVDELYVDARDRILPTYRVLAGIPDQPERRCASHGVRARGVRTMTPTVTVHLACHCTNTSAVVSGAPIALSAPNTVLRCGDGDR